MLSIQKLAGHESLETTQRYMHLSRDAPRAAIDSLEAMTGGGGVEAESSAVENAKESTQ